ncbi:MAG: hypothetical protein JSU70_02310 [Phycisphaerales bacterium]|nr:MAG: hypothetical protein JSU70_02310 [Phycisphaerales bacterium]
MKRTVGIFGVWLLATAVAVAADPPAAGQNPASSAGTGRSAPKSLLKTGTTNVVNREVVGRGHDRDEAIKNALYRAVEQARGVKVDSGTFEFGFRGAGAGIGAEDPGGRRIEFDSVDVATRGTAYTTEIGGLIKNYDVLEEKQIDEQTYEVKLRVAVYDYAARGQTARVKVALMPVKTPEQSYRFLNLTISGDTLSGLFSRRLAVGLTQTNKFAVLDRESLSDFAKERNMLLSLDAPLGEQAKVAETLGADYLLVGTISQAKIDRIDKYLKVADYTAVEFKARFKLDYRLVDSSTKQVVLASTTQKYLEDEKVRELADELSPAEWDPAQVRDAFISLVVNDVIAAIIDRVYPITIAGVQQGGQVVLNQGGNRIAKGMMLDVFTKGAEVFDVDTKESLGAVENRVATIEVQMVTHTMSFATVVAGDSSKVSQGLVCRIKKQKGRGPVGTRPDVIRTDRGGVKLPFDR